MAFDTFRPLVGSSEIEPRLWARGIPGTAAVPPRDGAHPQCWMDNPPAILVAAMLQSPLLGRPVILVAGCCPILPCFGR